MALRATVKLSTGNPVPGCKKRGNGRLKAVLFATARLEHWLHLYKIRKASDSLASLVLLHHQGTFLLGLLHLRLLIAIWLPQSTVQHLCCCIMNLLPTMKATTLAQSAHSVGECVVHVMEPGCVFNFNLVRIRVIREFKHNVF